MQFSNGLLKSGHKQQISLISEHIHSLTPHPNESPDSEKCSTPAAEDGHHFNIPLFPYSWSAYSGSELRHLVQGQYHHHQRLQGHREPQSPVSIYGAEDSGTEPLYAQRGPAAGCYQDYSSTAQQIRRMRDAEQLYVDVKHKPRGAEIKSENDFICSNFESSGSYKCIKCCKVRFSVLVSKIIAAEFAVMLLILLTF